MNNNFIQKSWIILLLIGVFLGAGGAFWYWADSVRNNLEKVVEISSGGNEAQQIEKIQAMRKELRNTQKEREKLHTLTIQEAQVPELLNAFELLGNENNSLFVRSVDIDTATNSLHVTLSISGSFLEVMATLKNVNQSKYAVYINSFEMRHGKKEETKKDIWDASMRVALPLVTVSSKDK